MITNPTRYAQALRAPAPPMVPHPAVSNPNGVRAPAGGIPLPDTTPRPYPMGGGFAAPSTPPPVVDHYPNPAGVSMPAPPRIPETYRPNQGRMGIPAPAGSMPRAY
jgi:hypothetical protein